MASPWFALPPKPIGDGPDYENIAFHVWQGAGFVIDSTNPQWQAIYRDSPSDYAVHLNSPRNLPTTGRPPLFPLIVAGIYGLVGRDASGFAAVRLFSATCLAVSGAIAVYLVAWLWTHQPLGTWIAKGNYPRWWPLLAGCGGCLGLWAINRTLREYATDFLTEPLALLWMQLFLCLAICWGSPGHMPGKPSVHPDDWIHRGTWWRMVALGSLWGLLILTRSMFVVWLPAVWLLCWLGVDLPRKKRLVWASGVVLVACCVCGPWWVRNCLVLNRWMPLGTQGATTLLGGYSDAARRGNGDWQAEPELALRAELAAREDFRRLPDDTARELVVAREASSRVRRWISEHRGDLPSLIAKRVYVHWNPYSGASLLWKLPLLVGGFGLLLARTPAALWLLGLPLTSTLVVAAFYSTGGRFLVPLYGDLFTVAGLGIAWSVAWLARRTS